MKAHSNSSAGEPAVLAELIQQHSLDPLRKAARDLRLTEDLALALLERRDLPHQVIEDLTKNMAVMKHRRVINAVVVHRRSLPRFQVEFAPRSARRFAAQRENAAGPSGGLRREHVFYGAARNPAALTPAAQRERIFAENSGAAAGGN